jgi:hypothetical protein
MDTTTFSGTIKANGPSNSFVITAQTEDGNMTLNGAPFVQYPLLEGTWIIEKTTQGGVMYTEIFSAVNTPGTNEYELIGFGADTCVAGMGALSRVNNQNVGNLDIALTEYQMPETGCQAVTSSTPNVVSTAIGTYNLSTGVTTLNGVQQGSPGPKVSMKVWFQP